MVDSTHNSVVWVTHVRGLDFLWGDLMGKAPETSLAGQLTLMLGGAVRAARNTAASRSIRDKWRVRGMVLLGVVFWVGVYLASRRVLVHVQTEIPDFWQPIHFKLLSMVLLTFFAILLFSNVVTSLSTFFLSDDLELIWTLPVDLEGIYLAKFAETLVLSSWMIIVFGLPVLVAFGVTWGAGFEYYFLWIPATLMPFILIPAALGSALTMILVKVFPARRARDLLAALSIIVMGILFLLFRLLRPEQFVKAGARVALWENVMRFDAADFLPSEWMTRVLMEVLRGNGAPGLTTLLLISTGPALVVMVGWLAGWIYSEGWSKAQEGRRARISRSGPFGFLVEVASRAFPSSMRAMVIKDVKTFFRDTTQWSQLFLLGAIMVVYVFNFRVLPLGELPVSRFKLVNYVSFVNLALAAFVVAAVAARFVFPMVSLEGRAWWIIRSSPLEMWPYLWSKFVISFVPLAAIAEIILGVTNYLLGVSPFMAALGSWSVLVLTFGITGMGVGMGAMHPRFHVENAAQISVSYGGVVYMIAALGVIAGSVVILVTPTVAIFQERLHNQPVSDFLWGALFVALVIITAGSVALAWIYMKLGVGALGELEA